MRISTNIRNWGNGSEATVLLEAVQAAEAGGIGTVWVNDRLSTPPGRGWPPGDGGRYLDPMLTLGFLAGVTTRIALGTGVLNLPYRPAFQVVKEAATLQDLSGGRLRFGVGVGWYETEFRALGVPYAERGERTDRALALLHEAFARDAVTVHGAELPSLPRPPRPRVYVGGRSDAALERVVRFGDGWIPAGMTPGEVAGPIGQLRERAEQAGKPAPEIIAMKTLPLQDVDAALELCAAYARAGVHEVVHAEGYADAAAFRRRVDVLAERVIPAAARLP